MVETKNEPDEPHVYKIMSQGQRLYVLTNSVGKHVIDGVSFPQYLGRVQRQFQEDKQFSGLEKKLQNRAPTKVVLNGRRADQPLSSSEFKILSAKLTTYRAMEADDVLVLLAARGLRK